MKLLVIEDEKELRDAIVAYLKGENYLCHTAHNLASAFEKIDTNEYDCIVMDIGLPDGSGLEILKELKAAHKLDAVLIISAHDSLDDKITGLNLGADDYLTKPFHLSELSARIAAIIRRKNFDGSAIITFHELSIDTAAQTISIHNRPLELTRKEYELLLYFVTNKKRVISKTAIADHLWGDDIGGNYDFIYTHVKNLRRKMVENGSEDYIRSVYGMGYKFTDS